MLNEELAIKKSKRKSRNCYGVSIVCNVSSCINILNMIAYLKQIPELISNFFWIDSVCLHVTLVRCCSVLKDFEISTDFLNYIEQHLDSQKKFQLKASKICLDEDGVIRLYLSKVPHIFFENISIEYLDNISGLTYKVISEPWITIAYSIPTQLENLKKYYEYFNKQLSLLDINFTIGVHEVEIVKYSDNSLKNKIVQCKITLKDDR